MVPARGQAGLVAWRLVKRTAHGGHESPAIRKWQAVWG